MTMDKVTTMVLSDHRGHPPPPPPPPPPPHSRPPTSSPPPPPLSTPEEYCHPKLKPEDDDEDDAEVMQVVSNGPVSLRSKKQRIGINGILCEEDDMNRERPMSWEGELSDDELMEPRRSSPLPPPPPQIHGDHSQQLTIGSPSSVLCQPPGSPMCMDDEGHLSDLGKAVKNVISEKEVSLNDNSNNSSRPGSSNCSILNSTCGSHTTITLTKATSPSPFSGNQQSNDRPPVAHNSLYESPLPNHHSPAQSRNLIGYSGPYSQTPSPILTRPTSSSSSRSSYSPSQSPLMGRYVNNASSLYSHSTQSPVLSRHTAGNSSDGSVCSPSGSPLQGRHAAVEGSVFSPTQSPIQSRRGELDGFSPSRSPGHLDRSSVPRHRPYSVSVSPSLVHRAASGTPDQQVIEGSNSLHAPYQYVQQQDHMGLETRINQVSPFPQHPTPETRSTASSASVASSASDESNASDFSSPTRRPSSENLEDSRLLGDLSQNPLGLSGPPGISRQQLLSGPCPICNDRISGFHYGIFSCESCKGFFKRTVQNKKNYVCLRGANCHVAISTRKKCPACRFNKCLRMGMKLEAIREDRTRGGRSTYQCSYTLPTAPLNEDRVPYSNDVSISPSSLSSDSHTKQDISSSRSSKESAGASSPDEGNHPIVPPLIHDILSVEHLWHYTDRHSSQQHHQHQHQQQPTKIPEGDQDFLSNLCNIADNRLYKIVKWCKSLPLFREIGMDDQIALLINSWCELLLLSCCYRSMSTPNEIRISHEKSVTAAQAKALGLSPVIDRMMNLTDHLRRLQVDQYEYVSLKVIILLTSDAHGLKEPDKVRACQKQVLEALQNYTASHYPQQPSKFGELLLRLPELERACQVGKDSLTTKQKAGDMPSFNLLMELLRGDH